MHPPYSNFISKHESQFHIFLHLQYCSCCSSACCISTAIVFACQLVNPDNRASASEPIECFVCCLLKTRKSTIQQMMPLSYHQSLRQLQPCQLSFPCVLVAADACGQLENPDSQASASPPVAHCVCCMSKRQNQPKMPQNWHLNRRLLHLLVQHSGSACCGQLCCSGDVLCRSQAPCNQGSAFAPVFCFVWSQSILLMTQTKCLKAYLPPTGMQT